MKIFFIWVLLIRRVYSIYCPEYCECHMKDEYRYVGCANKGLISIELDVPNSVQWLQLSDNSIHTLHNYAFSNVKLVQIERLELNRNAISSIGRLAFHGMDRLTSLDLSYNHLYSLDPTTFEHSGKLVKLDLSSNPLRRLSEPFLVSSSIQILNVKSCNLGYIPTNSFLKLPNLRILGLTNNQLNKLLPSSIQYLTHLVEIDLTGNHIKCDLDTDDLLTDFYEKGVNIYGVNCPIISRKTTKTDASSSKVPYKINIKNEDKFQRMVMTMPSITTTTSKYKPHYKEDSNEERERVEQPVKCVNTLADHTTSTNNYKNVLLLIIVFFSGLSLGALLAYTSMALFSLYWRCQKRKRELNRLDIEMNRLQQQTLLQGTVSNCTNMTSSTPSAPPHNY